MEEDSPSQKLLNLLSSLGGDKGVPKFASKTKGVRGGPQLDFSKFFKPKALDGAEKNRYKSIFELLGQTLQIGKYAKPEAESLKGSVAAPIAKKVDDSEKGKGKDDGGGGFFGGLINSIMKSGVAGLIGIAAALGVLGLAISQFTDIPWESILKAGVVLGGLLLVGLGGIAGSFGFLLMAAGLIAIIGNEDGPGPKFKGPIKQLADVSWDTIGKAGAILGGLLAVGLVGIPGSVGFLIMAAGLTALVGIEDGPLKFRGPIKQFEDIKWETIGKAVVVLGLLAGAGALFGTFAPLMLFGAAAIGALSLALVPLGAAAWLAAPAIEALTGPIEGISMVLDKLANVPVENLLLIGPALAGIGAGLVAMSGGNLVGAALDKFGSFFLNDKGPMEKLAELGRAAPDIIKLGDAFDTIADFSFSDIDLEGDFNLAVDGVDNLTGSMDKLAISQQKVVGLFKQITDSSAALQKSGTAGINNTFKMDKELVDVNKQQVSLLSQIKDGIMMMVDKPTTSNNISMIDQSVGKVKELATTLDFNKSMGVANTIQ